MPCIKDLPTSGGPTNAQAASLVKGLTNHTWIQHRAERAQAIIAREALDLEKKLRESTLEMAREVLGPEDAEVQKWGLRRLKDRPAKYEYWSALLKELIHLGEAAGEWGSLFEDRFKQIYGEHPSRHEDLILCNARALAWKREPGDPAVDPNLASQTVALLKQDLEEVDREYEVYQQRETELAAAMRGACLSPNNPQSILAQRKSESAGRQIKQSIELLTKLKRLEAELVGQFGGTPCAPEPTGVGPGVPPVFGNGQDGPATKATMPQAAAEAIPESPDPVGGRTPVADSDFAIAKASPDGAQTGANEDESHHVIENKASTLAGGQTNVPLRPLRDQDGRATKAAGPSLRNGGNLDSETVS